MHNIMVVQDMVKQYGRKSTKPSCLIMLTHLGFPTHFIEMIMECVTTPKFSFMINGAMKGYFGSTRGLRQGEPMSPMPFVICMEYLSRVFGMMSQMEQFHFHPKCQTLKLTHLCFADDLILCSKGEFSSVYMLLQAFKIFSDSSGLKANVKKSEFY